MGRVVRSFSIICAATVLFAFTPQQPSEVDREMVAKIREEGFQHSQVMDIAGYMSDVLGARLTLSEDMKSAQTWAIQKMEEIGLENTTVEPFMDFGVTWDNEYFSLHMMEPDYQPLVGYPLAHTPGTQGRITSPVVISEITTRQDLERYRGKLDGMVVLTTPPAVIDLERLARATPRRTDEELEQMAEDVTPPQRGRSNPAARNPDLLGAMEKIAFYKAEGVLALLECRSGWLGAVRGFSRPGSGQDRWSREGDLNSLPIIAVTPEHYNRMYRIRERGIPVTI
ncbi:hypothetical protein ACFL6T_05980, partial [Candidatus Zixiibacteriota bacterium]